LLPQAIAELQGYKFSPQQPKGLNFKQSKSAGKGNNTVWQPQNTGAGSVAHGGARAGGRHGENMDGSGFTKPSMRSVMNMSVPPGAMGSGLGAGMTAGSNMGGALHPFLMQQSQVRQAIVTLYVDGVPLDATGREMKHLFRPFPGFRSRASNITNDNCTELAQIVGQL
jgi:hypothetical protein